MDKYVITSKKLVMEKYDIIENFNDFKIKSI